MNTAAERLTAKEQRALDYLRLARAECPETDDGVLTWESTSYDGGTDVAYVHFKTAASLVRKGFARYGEYDPEGTSLWLAQPSVSASVVPGGGQPC